MKKMVLLFILLYPSHIIAGHLKPERWYQEKWCIEHAGQIEFKLPDKTRCDCLTDSHAVEVDFAGKWYQAMGQSLYYSMQTGKRAGILLILESATDRKYWIRLNSTIQHFNLPIDTWVIELN